MKTLEQMHAALHDIELIEKDLMRDLTEDEKQTIVNDGFKTFFNDLKIDKATYKLIRNLKDIVGQYMSGTIEDYDKAIAKSTPEMKEIFNFIAKDIDEHLHQSENKLCKCEDAGICNPGDPVSSSEDQCCYPSDEKCCYPSEDQCCSSDEECCSNPAVDYDTTILDTCISALKSGKELTLNEKLIDNIIDKLWETEDNIQIKVVNNTISIK